MSALYQCVFPTVDDTIVECAVMVGEEMGVMFGITDGLKPATAHVGDSRLTHLVTEGAK